MPSREDRSAKHYRAENRPAKRGRRRSVSRAVSVLLAEDNPVNRQLMNDLLRNRNYRVHLAVDGVEALAAWEKYRFDAVLMDVQMPGMNGLETTAAIRERERGSGRHTPIIATTAHAMARDRERALSAGMDAYLSKPIRATELYDMIDRLTGQPAGAKLDGKTLLAGLAGNRKMLRSLIRIFLKDCPRMVRQIRTAIRAGRSDSLRTAAHALKGAAGNFGPNGVFEAARELETIGKESRMDEAAAAFEKLKRQLLLLRHSLSQLG